MPAEPVEREPSRRFLLVFATVLGLALGSGALLIRIIDPTQLFGPGNFDAVLARVDTKPAAFLARRPRPAAIVLGSSRVMKINPTCVEELTGLPAFNLGLSNTVVEHWVAAYRFARAHTTLRRIVIGVDVEAFDPHLEVDQLLRSSHYLSPYLDEPPSVAWSKVGPTLFGFQTLRFALTVLGYHFRPSTRPSPNTTLGPNGFLTYPIMEKLQREGALPKAQYEADSRHLLETRFSGNKFSALSAVRVRALRRMLREAHGDGIEVDAFIPPIEPALDDVRAATPFPARRTDVVRLLLALQGEGLLRYHEFSRPEDFGGDPNAYFDGLHMMESNTSHLLLAITHQKAGCGVVNPGSLPGN